MAYIENNACHAAPRSTASLRQFYNVWHSRRALAALDDAALNDIGLSRFDAYTEANRPFWDVPNTWRK
jgi:uncharacterized protein YjiS (DUF1127 family)|tara:strand:+ start:1645 stop:1848 length:204 start_codon:yes stop_codon:yes gene_type:complete